MSKKGVNVIKIVGVSAFIIIAVLGYANYRGIFRGQVDTKLPIVEASVEKLEKVTNKHETEIKILQTVVPKMQVDINAMDHRHEKRFDKIDNALIRIEAKM